MQLFLQKRFFKIWTRNPFRLHVLQPLSFLHPSSSIKSFFIKLQFHKDPFYLPRTFKFPWGITITLTGATTLLLSGVTNAKSFAKRTSRAKSGWHNTYRILSLDLGDQSLLLPNRCLREPRVLRVCQLLKWCRTVCFTSVLRKQ